MLVDNSIDFDCAILCVISKANTFFAIIADLARIQIAQVAFAAFNTLAIVQNTGSLIHDLIHFFPLSLDIL